MVYASGLTMDEPSRNRSNDALERVTSASLHPYSVAAAAATTTPRVPQLSHAHDSKAELALEFVPTKNSSPTPYPIPHGSPTSSEIFDTKDSEKLDYESVDLERPQKFLSQSPCGPPCVFAMLIITTVE
ncbi:hypothetical protein M0802_004054 [Mischocyttarus mexicanus]|nr:hypothetical protein M0802_004054 [Mischocyttarus mexicanus]